MVKIQLSRNSNSLDYRLMRMVNRIAAAILLVVLLDGCVFNSEPDPLGRIKEPDRNKTIVLDRSDEEVEFDERRVASQTTETNWLLPWTWF